MPAQGYYQQRDKIFMAIYKFQDNEMQRVEDTTFSAEGILERQNLQEALKRQIDAIAPDCLVIAEEFSEWSDSKRRIDLLAVDREGNLVVIELKRTETGEHMDLQALRYSAMVSTLTFNRATEIYSEYLLSIGEKFNAEDKLLEFLGWEESQEDGFALDVRIVLVSADFSKELTTSVMWLNERDIDIRCVRLSPFKYEDQLLLDIQQIIPLPEAESYQVKIKQKNDELKEARRSSRDLTRYRFEGDIFNKRKLVLAVVLRWVSEYHPTDLPALLEAFPKELRRSGLFTPHQEAREICERTGIPRHFLGDGDVLVLADSEKYAVSNQWSKTSIDRFVEQARSLGYEIEESTG